MVIGVAVALPIQSSMTYVHPSSRLQSLDAVVITCVERRFNLRRIERAADLVEQGVTYSQYKPDCRTAFHILRIYGIHKQTLLLQNIVPEMVCKVIHTTPIIYRTFANE